MNDLRSEEQYKKDVENSSSNFFLVRINSSVCTLVTASPNANRWLKLYNTFFNLPDVIDYFKELDNTYLKELYSKDLKVEDEFIRLFSVAITDSLYLVKLEKSYSDILTENSNEQVENPYLKLIKIYSSLHVLQSKYEQIEKHLQQLKKDLIQEHWDINSIKELLEQLEDTVTLELNGLKKELNIKLDNFENQNKSNEKLLNKLTGNSLLTFFEDINTRKLITIIIIISSIFGGVDVTSLLLKLENRSTIPKTDTNLAK